MDFSAQDLRWKVQTAALSSRIPFELRCRLLYWRKRRCWPTRHPETFSQKMLWKLVKDRRPLITTFQDKIAVRDYVTRVVGNDVLSTLHAVVSDPGDLSLDMLPAEFVVKPNHASGLIWIVTDRIPSSTLVHSPTAPIRSGSVLTARDELDWTVLVATCRQWLAFEYIDIAPEWAYRNVPPRIMVEELLLDPDGRIPPDYKFFVLNGRVRLIEVHSDRFTGHRCDYFLPDWTPADVQVIYPPAEADAYPPSGHRPPRPESFHRMVHIAEALGQETDFVRVDLYDTAGRVVFGELTNYPGGANARFSPESFDRRLGRYWSVPKRYG